MQIYLSRPVQIETAYKVGHKGAYKVVLSNDIKKADKPRKSTAISHKVIPYNTSYIPITQNNSNTQPSKAG